MKKTLLDKAMKINELAYSLTNISTDDKRELESYSDDEILDEAEYVLSTFFEANHINNDDLTNRFDDKEAQREARKQLKALQKLVAQYRKK